MRAIAQPDPPRVPSGRLATAPRRPAHILETRSKGRVARAPSADDYWKRNRSGGQESPSSTIGPGRDGARRVLRRCGSAARRPATGSRRAASLQDDLGEPRIVGAVDCADHQEVLAGSEAGEVQDEL